MIFDERVVGIEKLTYKDFPGKLACVLFYAGCNAHCPYCYDTDVVKCKLSYMDSRDVQKFLLDRKGKLDGVVFCGGECTLHQEDLLCDLRWCKDNGFLTKIDTNGSNPSLVDYAVKNGLVDYISIDYKAPESKINSFYSKHLYKLFLETLMNLIQQNTINFEVRTTVHRDVINEDDLSQMSQTLVGLGYTKPYYIQQFFEGEDVKYLDETLDRHPEKLDLRKVDSHGLTLVER